MPAQGNTTGQGLFEHKSSNPKVFNPPITTHRKNVKALLATAESPEPNITTKTISVPIAENSAITIKIYRPNDVQLDTYPTLLHIPGSAFTALEDGFSDACLSHIAHKSGCQVILINHRLAPECPFPTPLLDVYQIILWLLDNAARFKINTDCIISSGYSSGGTIAATTTYWAKKAGLPICSQILISPLTDLSRSLKEYKKDEDLDNIIPNHFVEWFLSQYIPKNTDLKDPDLSPYYQEDVAILPPTDIIFGEFDRFKSDAIAYGKKLDSAKVSLTCWQFFKEKHGLFWHNMQVLDCIAARLRQICHNTFVPKSLPLYSSKHRLIVLDSNADDHLKYKGRKTTAVTPLIKDFKTRSPANLRLHT